MILVVEVVVGSCKIALGGEVIQMLCVVGWLVFNNNLSGSILIRGAKEGFGCVKVVSSQNQKSKEKRKGKKANKEKNRSKKKGAQ